MCYNKKMSSLVFVILTVWCTLLRRGVCQLEGDTCTLTTGIGVCKPIIECSQALDYLMTGVRPKVCGFIGKEAQVCCPLSPTTLRSSSTPDYEDYEGLDLLPGTECSPIPHNATKARKTGQIAWDKCIGYLQYVYPCELSETLSARKDMARRNRCGHGDTELPEGTNRVADGELPHMALLGYGSSVDWATWACAGAIVSERYVLTAATCIAKGSDMVSFVRVGLVRISSTIDQSSLYNVSKFITAPRYNQRQGFNDIGLVQTATPMIFNNRIYPACLHTGNPVDDVKMMATGWGLANFNGIPGTHLQKVTLNKLQMEDCSSGSVKRRQNSQICAGYQADTNGNCQVDAGSPLQIFNKDVGCTYTVLGVTSVGPNCGSWPEYGIFTRVSKFTQWIESVVWS